MALNIFVFFLFFSHSRERHCERQIPTHQQRWLIDASGVGMMEASLLAISPGEHGAAAGGRRSWRRGPKTASMEVREVDCLAQSESLRHLGKHACMHKRRNLIQSFGHKCRSVTLQCSHWYRIVPSQQ